jgi:hypothetical protein
MKKYNKEKRAIIWRNYYLKNREKLLAKNKLLRENNPEYYKKYEKDRYSSNPEFYKNKHRKYSKENREAVNKYAREKYANDIDFKLRCILRSRLLVALKGKQKSDKTINLIGCTIPELRVHIEKQFKDGMDWTNWKYKGWHVDHIIPISSFNLVDKNELSKACHYTNLQPMWSLDNHKKGAKLNNLTLGGDSCIMNKV